MEYNFPLKSFMGFPSDKFQVLRIVSWPYEVINFPSLLKEAPTVGLICPFNFAKSRPEGTSQILAAFSLDSVTNIFPLGLNVAVLVEVKIFKSLPEGTSQSLATFSLDHVTIIFPSGLNMAVLYLAAWALVIVSDIIDTVFPLCTSFMRIVVDNNLSFRSIVIRYFLSGLKSAES